MGVRVTTQTETCEECPKDRAQFDLAVKLPADVLLAAVKQQANNSVFSEAYCLELAGAYNDAAEVARERRLTPRRVPEIFDDSFRNKVE
jgi:hypothetical protein